MMILALFLFITADPPATEPPIVEEHGIKPPPEVSPY